MSEKHRAEPPFHELLGARCLTRGGGKARYELTVGPGHLNRRGVAHGGVVAGLLDTALGTAVVSAIAKEEWCGTMELSVQFREPVLPGPIIAEGEVRDPAGRVLATAHGVWTIWPVRPPASSAR